MDSLFLSQLCYFSLKYIVTLYDNPLPYQASVNTFATTRLD